MKTILKTTATVVAIATATIAQAQSSTSSGTTTIYSATPTPSTTTYNPLDILKLFPIVTPGKSAAAQFADNVGSKYEASFTTPNNTESNSTSVANTFTLNGNVTKDCSFYGGGTTGHTIALGTIGVRTGNDDNVTIAFNQRSAITASVTSATAGCNTNNTVTIAKANGSVGLQNKTPGSFDSAQFTDRIPYTIKATWTGVAAGSTATGTQQELNVNDGAASNFKTGGAWRSTFDMDVNAPAQSKGLVAGDYTDTITVTLAVI